MAAVLVLMKLTTAALKGKQRDDVRNRNSFQGGGHGHYFPTHLSLTTFQ